MKIAAKFQQIPNGTHSAYDEPAFMDDDGPSAEIPSFITTKNAIDLFGLRPDETVLEAMARCNVHIPGQPSHSLWSKSATCYGAMWAT